MRFYIDGYSATKLVRVFSRRVPSNLMDIAGTNLGLLAVIGCNGSPCSVKVSPLSTVTGATIRSIPVANAVAVLAGGEPTVIGYRAKSNTYFLARLAG